MGGASPINLEGMKDADLLIGVPLYNNASTLGGVLEAIAKGVTQYFPQARTVLVCSDGGSTDGSEEIFRKTLSPNLQMVFATHPVSPVHKILPPYHGIPGKENALKILFETAQKLQVKACAVVDSSLSSMNPEWVSLLLRPVLEEDFDFIAPLYARHPFEGTISSGILYPLHRVLYRKIIRYPLANDFGASGKVLRHLLSRKIAEDENTRAGVDLWITSQVLTGGFKVGQSFLGPRVQNVRDGKGNLGTMFHQALSTAYRLMEEHQSFWRENGEIQAVAAFGRPEGNPPGGSFDPERMIANFRLGAKALVEIWRKILSPETARGVEVLQRLPGSRFSFPPGLWARVIYDFAAGFHRELVHRDHLLKSMIPLYLGWVASFYVENREAPASAVEEKIESLCRIFEDQKLYLLEHWEGKGG
jgi:glucosylglycerate synthase